MLDDALCYAARGWYVFPCHSLVDGRCSCGAASCGKPGKHPRTPHGMLDGTTDQSRIRDWWERFPGSNIGIYCKASRLIALDIDVERGGMVSAFEMMEECGLEAFDTLIHRTGGGGFHYLFAWPDGYDLRNDADWAPGIDTRTNGYIIAPPSLHASGRRYEVADGSPPIPFPPELQAWFAARSKKRTPPPLRPSGDGRPADLERYARAALDAECGRVRSATEGNRNNTLNLAAFSLGTLAAAGVIPEGVVRQELLEAARNWPGQVDWRETERTLESGLKGGLAHPRSIPTSAAPLTVTFGRVLGTPSPPADDWDDEGAEPDDDRLRPLTLPELYAKAASAGQIRWVVPNGIARGFTHLLSAPPKSGKTWFGLTLSHAVCTGTPWAGTAGIEQGPVLWIDEEMGAQLLARRLRQLGFSPDLPFHTLTLAGFRLDQDGDVSRVMDEACRLDAALIVVDSLRRVHRLQENENSEMRLLLPMLHGLASTNAAVVVLHHDRKRTLNDSSEQERSSGALDLIAQVDMVYGMKRDRNTYTLSCRSARLLGEERAASIAFRLEDRDDGTVEVTPLSAREEKANSQAALEEAILFHLAMNPGDNSRGICTTISGRETDIRAALHRMVEDKRLTMDLGARNSKLYRVNDGHREEDLFDAD